MAIRYDCDMCGIRLGPNDSDRYIVKIEAFAAAGPLEIAEDDLAQDPSAALTELIDDLKSADPNEIEDQTYRSFRFDLCPTCHRRYLKDPLGKTK